MIINQPYSSMLAYELLAHLKFLTLAGYEDGEYVFIGSDDEWQDTRSEIAHYEITQLKESESDIDYQQEVMS